MQVDVLFAAIPVSRIGPSAVWYERFFGRPPEIVPNDTEVMWRLADGAWLYVVVDERRAGHGLVTICVPDLDAEVADLEERGMSITKRETVGEAGRKAWVEDPDGNAIAVLEVSGPPD